MDKYEIAVLAEDESSKRLVFESYGMMNTFGLTAAERVELDIKYAIAKAEWVAAKVALEKAINAATH